MPELPPAVVETHGSTVCFIADRAYKFLKPVVTGFFDYSTPELRRIACERELRLNRRFAPDVYLGLGQIEEHGAVTDHVIVMRRLPDDRRLAVLVVADPHCACVEDVARVVATVHRSLGPVTDGARLADAEALRGRWSADIDELRSVGATGGIGLDTVGLDEVERRVGAWLAGRRPLLDERVGDGWIRDGHGDLLADDVFCLDDGPRIIDCLAFDDDLRVGDVVADVAFLAMDLERLAGWGAARRFLDAYTQHLDHRAPPSLVHVAIAQRALVRAKVAAIRDVQRGGGDVERSGGETAARLAQCVEHLRRAEIRWILVGGPPGTGKTTTGARIAADIDAVHLRSDEIRKELAGLGRSDRSGGGSGLYEPSVSVDTYRELIARAVSAAERGRSVVLDANWPREEWRSAARAAAAGCHSRVVELRCVLDAAEVRRRIEARMERDDDASDATPEVAERLAAGFEAWPEAIVIDTRSPTTVPDGEDAPWNSP